MTDSEVHSEIHRDFNVIQNDFHTKLALRYDRARRKNKIKKDDPFVIPFKVVTPCKNTWFIIMNKSFSEVSYKGLETISITNLVYYYTNIGIRVFRIDPNVGISVFNAHLFSRYNERLNKNIVEPIEKVLTFFNNNPFTHSKVIKKDNRIYLMGKIRQGIILGEIMNNGYWMVWKTYISDDLKREYQNQIERDLHNSLKNEISKSFSNNSYWDNSKNADLYHAIYKLKEAPKLHKIVDGNRC
ncbi:hypothetical protein [uncultured Draconibacterium sp.]|uniref:hypothetical protein n=1 Tax=uncultured Draconibacterium sp. TaxID=1573823 RepID=UPI0025F0E64F|nr:hypothetical protein [uncultured Draconibacterium sp.]